MSIVYHERPGVYSDYTVSRLTASGGEKQILAMAAYSTAKTGLYTVTARESGLAAFGSGSTLGKMLAAAYDNGAGTVLVYSMDSTEKEAYEAAFDALLSQKKAALICTDSHDAAVQAALAAALQASAGQKGECIGIVGMEDPTVEQLLERAAALDCERMVLVGPDVYEGTTLAGGCVAAAALGGLLAGETDPALPLNGAKLQSFDGVCAAYSETEIDALVRGGVTVLEASGGAVSVLRGITTRQTVGDGRDTTWRELTTVRICDDVIPGIRNALAARFSRAKNNAVTRSAIYTQVLLELESRVRREIIDGYENLSVEPSAADACVCRVKFGFTVTHGLNRIHLTANISV